MTSKKVIKVSVLTVIAILILLFISFTVFAYSNNIKTLAEAKAYAESIFFAERNEIMNKMSDYSFNEILTEIKNIEKNNGADEETLKYYHLALSEKMSTASKNEVTSAILDTSLSAESRATIIISAESNKILLDYEQLNKAITDDKYADIRPLLIELIADATPDNIAEIEKIVDNKSTGFSKAIKTLWEIKPTKAEAVADEIFANYSGEYDEIFRGAFSIKSYQAMHEPTDKICDEYIALCDRILNTPCTDKEERETYIISWMQEIQSKKILIYFKSKGYESRMCGPYLSLTLNKMLSEPATIDNIDLFLHFYPYTTTHNVWEAINIHIKNNNEFYKINTALKRKLEQISIENYEVVSVLAEPNKPREVK